MNKIIGIFIVMLLIASAIPSIGMINEIINNAENKMYDYQDSNIVPGEFIVKFKESPINCESVNRLNKKYKVSSMREVFKNVKNTKFENVYILSVPEDNDILKIIEESNKLMRQILK